MHIGMEINEGAPARADCYATTPVVLKTSVVGVGTALDHAFPNAIEFSPALSVPPCGVYAAATGRFTAAQIVGQNASFCAADTLTPPDCIFPAGFEIVQHRPPAELLASNINTKVKNHE